MSEALTNLAAHSDDEGVHLFAEIISCISTLPLGRWDEAREHAERLYHRSVEVDNLAWARRVLGLHERLGSGWSRI